MPHGPNRTVAAARSRKLALTAQTGGLQSEADATRLAEQWRESGRCDVVRVTSYALGPRVPRGHARPRYWVVRGYLRAKVTP